MIILDNISQQDKDIVSNYLDTFCNSIIDFIDLDNHVIIIKKSLVDTHYNSKDQIYHGTEVNIAIASSITSYSRIFMTFIKNNPEFKLYYTDTDSWFINKPLPEYLIGNKLGQFKLENVITKAIFLAPKVYGYLNTEGKEIIKVKGLTNDVVNKLNLSDLEALLIKDSSREFTQEKWFKYITSGEISIQDIIYTLKVTSNKRKHIYIDEVFNFFKWNDKCFNNNKILIVINISEVSHFTLM